MTTLGSACEVIAGQSPEGIHYNQNGVGEPFYQGKKEFGDRFVGVATTWTTRVTKQANSGDIVMSVRAPVGPVNILRSSACIGRGLAAIRPRSGVDRDFIYYQLQAMQNQIAGTEGAVFASINKSQIEALPIWLPPLVEQQRIVAKLEALLPEIEHGLSLVAQAQAKNDDVVLSSLAEMFQRHGASPSKSYGEVAELSLGKMLDRKKATGRHPTPYLRNVNVRWGVFDTSDVMEMDITPSELDRVSVRRGDVVVCEGGEPGRCAVWREERSMAIQKALHRMRPKPGMDSDYLALNLEYQIKCGTAKELFTGTTIKHLTGEKLQVMTLPVPPLREQREAVAHLKAVRDGADALRSVADARRRTLVAMRLSVLAAAFRGDL